MARSCMTDIRHRFPGKPARRHAPPRTVKSAPMPGGNYWRVAPILSPPQAAFRKLGELPLVRQHAETPHPHRLIHQLGHRQGAMPHRRPRQRARPDACAIDPALAGSPTTARAMPAASVRVNPGTRTETPMFGQARHGAGVDCTRLFQWPIGGLQGRQRDRTQGQRRKAGPLCGRRDQIWWARPSMARGR